MSENEFFEATYQRFREAHPPGQCPDAATRIVSARLIILALIATVALTGCSSLMPGADKIRFTDHEADVKDCKYAGAIGYSWAPGAAKEGNVRDFAIAKGGDTVLVRHLGAGAKVGLIYNCTGVDVRQPVPVAIVPAKG